MTADITFSFVKLQAYTRTRNESADFSPELLRWPRKRLGGSLHLVFGSTLNTATSKTISVYRARDPWRDRCSVCTLMMRVHLVDYLQVWIHAKGFTPRWNSLTHPQIKIVPIDSAQSLPGSAAQIREKPPPTYLCLHFSSCVPFHSNARVSLISHIHHNSHYVKMPILRLTTT